jgi:hypothetical protein
VLFPVYVAVLLWGGLWLRDARLRALLPLRARTQEGDRTPREHAEVADARSPNAGL